MTRFSITVIVLGVLAAVASCKKAREVSAEELRRDVNLSEANVVYWEIVVDSLRKRRDRTAEDSTRFWVAHDSLTKAEAKLDVARRELNRFTSGQ